MTKQRRTYVDVAQTPKMIPAARDALGDGDVFMLNLLKFREVADYSATPDIAPPTPISGREAYEHYLSLCEPGFVERGNEILLKGVCGPFLIGPEDERWDMVLIITSLRLEFMASTAQDEEYKSRVVGHRTAALEDSRLLPISTNFDGNH